MSSGSQFLEGTGDAASDLSLLFRRALTLAGLCTQSRFRRPPSGVDCARGGRDISRRGAPLMGTLSSIPAVSVSSWVPPGDCCPAVPPRHRPQRGSGVSTTFRFRHRSRTNPVSMHEDGRGPWPLKPTPLGSYPTPRGFPAVPMQARVIRFGPLRGWRRSAGSSSDTAGVVHARRGRHEDRKGLVQTSPGVDVGTSRMLAGTRGGRFQPPVPRS